MIHNGKIVITKSKIPVFLMCFLLVDAALLPYIRRIKCTMGMLMILLWYLRNFNRFRTDREFRRFIACLVIMVVSLVIGFSVLPSNLPANFTTGGINVINYDITYSAIIIFAFIYYFYFREATKEYYEQFYAVLKFISITIFSFACLYIVSPTIFYVFRAIFTLSGNTRDVTIGASYVYRYTYSFSDPNSISAISVAIMMLIFENKNEKIWKKYVYCAMMLISVIASMSAQGLMALVICLFIYVARLFLEQKKRISTISLLITVVAIVLLFAAWVIIQNQPVIMKSLGRVTSNSNSAQTRLGVWKNLLANKGVLAYVLFGNGNAISLNGYAIMPHNGHLYLLYSYGLIFYMLFISIFLWKKRDTKWSNLMFLIPLFVCFTINVGLIDARYAMFMAALTAFGFEQAKRYDSYSYYMIER